MIDETQLLKTLWPDPCPRCGGDVKYCGGYDRKAEKFFVHAACTDCHQITEGVEVTKQLYKDMEDPTKPGVIDVLKQAKELWDKGIYIEDEDIEKAVAKAALRDTVASMIKLTAKHTQEIREGIDASTKSKQDATYEYDLLKKCPTCNSSADYNFTMAKEDGKIRQFLQVKCRKCVRIAEAVPCGEGSDEEMDKAAFDIFDGGNGNKEAAKAIAMAAKNWNEDKLASGIRGEIIIPKIIQTRQIVLNHADQLMAEFQKKFGVKDE